MESARKDLVRGGCAGSHPRASWSVVALVALAGLAVSCGNVVIAGTGGGGGSAGGNTGANGGGGAGTGGSGVTATPLPQGFGTPCPFGVECLPEVPVCLTTGEGDAEAYCTRNDCKSDAECPTGFMCGVRREPHALCGSNPPKGNNAFCGKTDEPCVDPATLGNDGTTRFEGSLCLLRRACVKRDRCAPCTTDADCSLFVTQRCIQIGGEGRCAVDCGMEADCGPDETCSAKSCLPKFGACVGQGKFCQPCLDDTQCGNASTSVGCARLSFLESACFDFSFAASCSVDLDCPQAPGGKHGTCMDQSVGVAPGDPQYHKCYLPIDTSTNQTSCW